MATPIEALTDDQRELVARNLRLVGYAVRRWPYLVRGIGCKLEAQSIGNLALCQAARRYNPARGSYATFAMLTIWALFIKAANGDGDLIRVKDTTRRSHLRQSVVSLDAALEQDEADRADAERAIAVTDDAPGLDLFERQALASALAHLDKRKRRAVELRYLCGMNLPAIGKLLGVTKERTRQMVLDAEKALRAWLRLDDTGLHYLGRKTA